MNCKIKSSYYSYDYLCFLANKLGYNKDNRRTYFLSDNLYDNIFNPVLIFDIKKHEWNKSLLIDNSK